MCKAIRLISEVCLFTFPTQLLLKVLDGWCRLGGPGTVRGTYCHDGARAADAGARRSSKTIASRL